MRNLLVLFASVLSCFASPVVEKEAVQQGPDPKWNNLAYAVDLSAPVTPSGFVCFRQSRYNVAFIRGYSPAGSGVIDTYATSNIRNANNAGMGTEIYMTPQPNSPKSGAMQFDELYTNLRNSNINVKTVWIQVTSPINWFSSTSTNINFLNAILTRANQYGVKIGIYTSFYDWSQITGGAKISNAMLWYWNVYGGGPSNETPPNFSDFRPFGGWMNPSVKQFGQVESVCGVTVNRDVYTTTAVSAPAAMANHDKAQQITVGDLRFEGVALTGKPEIVL